MRDEPHVEEGGRDRRSPLPDRLVGLLTVETIALAIALVMPLTPSRTGSTWSFAHLYWPEPTYLQKVFATFLVGNALFALLGVVVWLLVRRDRARESGDGGGPRPDS